MILTNEMFKTGQPVAQGEVLIWKKEYAPKRIIEMLDNCEMSAIALNSNQLIVGHSETGHHHVIERVDVAEPLDSVLQVMVDKLNDTVIYLKSTAPVALKHLRNFNTHGELVFPPGEYVRIIREEQTVNGWRRVAD